MSYTPPLGNAVNFSLESYEPLVGNLVNFELAPPVTTPFFMGVGMSKKIGKPTSPDPLGVMGIWQMRMTKRGKVPIKMKYYVPTNPQTEPQQANRQKFADAMTAWHALTDEQKTEYNIRARHIGMFGRNLFIRDYYRSN